MLLFCMRSQSTGAVTEVFAEDLARAKLRIGKIFDIQPHVVEDEFRVTFATENYAQECPLKKVETVEEKG